MPRVRNPGWNGAPVRVRIRRIADRPGGALAARVHHEVGVAGRGPHDPLVGQPATAAVADVLHDGGHRALASSRHVEPGTDRGAAVAGERDIEGRDDRQPAVDRRERGGEVVRPRLVERRCPEPLEVGRDGERRRVGPHLGQGHVELGHGILRWRAGPLAAPISPPAKQSIWAQARPISGCRPEGGGKGQGGRGKGRSSSAG